MSSGNNSPSWQDRLRYEFRRNKSRSMILAVLAVVCLVMVVKLVVKKSPEAAQGQPLASASLPAGPAPVPAEDGSGAAGPGSGGAAKTSTGAPRAPVVVKVEFLRDLFRPDPAVFMAREDADPTTPDEARIQVRLEANALRLTSTMVGQTSCVTINGQLLRVNDWVEGFQVLSIAKGSCVVLKKGVRVQLDMES